MSYTVYKHTSPSEKVYIGITCMNVEDRWKNGNGYKSCKLFNHAIKKYGWENIKHEILFSGLTKEEACKKEIELIEQYHSCDPKFGYNLEKGGYGEGKHSEETLQKMSENRKGKCLGKDNPFYHKHHSEEWVKNHLCGENNPMYGVKGKEHPRYGIKHTEESLNKMRNAKKGKYVGSLNPHAKRIMCIETGEVFDYAKNAAEKMNINISCISNCCSGRNKTAGGYHWKYV